MALWIEVADADEYFETRLRSAAWSAASEEVKLAALTTAQADIEACADFTFDADAEVIAAQQNAVCEQALYLLQDEDQERRQSLQAQGVKEAGMAKEVYTGAPAGVVIAPRARLLLATGGFGSGTSSTFRVER